MKLHQPLLLLSISLATALTILVEASPIAPQAHTYTRSSTLTPLMQQQQQERPPQIHQASNLHQRRSRSGETPTADKTSTLLNNASSSSPTTNAPSPTRLQRRRRLGLQPEAQPLERSKRAKTDNINPSSPSTGPSTQMRSLLYKRAPPSPSPSVARRQPNASIKSKDSNGPSILNTPLLLLPDSSSVWQTGSYQTVQWSRKYAKGLPMDTTVDIVLVDANTNRKIYSLKRFIPFRKGAAQVRVPVKIPEGVSFVLVLELYRGRSQEQVTSTIMAAAAASSFKNNKGQARPMDKVSGTDSSSDTNDNVNNHQVFSNIVRRSDINISSGSNKVARDTSFSGSNAHKGNSNNNKNTNGGRNNGVKGAGSYDVSSNDYYSNPSEERPFAFLPDESREEYPNTVQPLDLEHTFGTHQKVYALTPYTLEWKIPARVAELMEYTRQAQLLTNMLKSTAGQDSQRPIQQPKTTFIAKVLIELVKDQTLETISVLARDVPAETMFLYLSIQDRVPQAFYRLRVQMVVVQVKTDTTPGSALEVGGQTGSSSPKAALPTPSPSLKQKGMEGWEFPTGGEVIDRFEAITRRFWVSQGAL
ncbi:hypothetical protein BG011_009851 [Mortierella polycephala]|uniref:Uncharacterized protein n=1 Tax=Mortierella polycephala TaxID=41804 RepID=A0A9P6U7E1_9FUNG|nr:hypothetical protein BG011_009851 [Mortierella polycephala]